MPIPGISSSMMMGGRVVTPGSTSITTTGTSNWTVPEYNTITFTMWGAGGGGNAGAGNGGAGGTTSISSLSLSAGGGAGGTADTIAGSNWTAGGAGGTASGGDTNTNGNAGSDGGGSTGGTVVPPQVVAVQVAAGESGLAELPAPHQAAEVVEMGFTMHRIAVNTGPIRTTPAAEEDLDQR